MTSKFNWYNYLTSRFCYLGCPERHPRRYGKKFLPQRMVDSLILRGSISTKKQVRCSCKVSSHRFHRSSHSTRRPRSPAWSISQSPRVVCLVVYREMQGFQFIIVCLAGIRGHDHQPTRGQSHGSALSSSQNLWYNYCEL